MGRSGLCFNSEKRERDFAHWPNASPKFEGQATKQTHPLVSPTQTNMMPVWAALFFGPIWWHPKSVREDCADYPTSYAVNVDAHCNTSNNQNASTNCGGRHSRDVVVWLTDWLADYLHASRFLSILRAGKVFSLLLLLSYVKNSSSSNGYHLN